MTFKRKKVITFLQEFNQGSCYVEGFFTKSNYPYPFYNYLVFFSLNIPGL